MYQLLKAKITANPRRAWWNARFTTTDGAVHENSPAPAQDTDTGYGSGGYVLGAPGDPDGYDQHCTEAAQALASANTEAEFMAAILIDVRRIDVHYESLVATLRASNEAFDLVIK